MKIFAHVLENGQRGSQRARLNPRREPVEESNIPFSYPIPQGAPGPAETDEDHAAVTGLMGLLDPTGIRQTANRLLNVLTTDTCFSRQIGDGHRFWFPRKELEDGSVARADSQLSQFEVGSCRQVLKGSSELPAELFDKISRSAHTARIHRSRSIVNIVDNPEWWFEASARTP